MLSKKCMCWCFIHYRSWVYVASHPMLYLLVLAGLWVTSSHYVIINYLITYISINKTNKLSAIIFIVYSYMFRLTWVIFLLELYLFAMSLCSFWDPRPLHVFCIDVIYSIIIGCCNKCNCYGIVTDYLDVFIGRNVCVDLLIFFVIYHTVCNWISSQDVSVLYAKHVKVWYPRTSTVTLQINIVLAWRWLMWVETCSCKL